MSWPARLVIRACERVVVELVEDLADAGIAVEVGRRCSRQPSPPL